MGHGACAAACPVGAITLVFGTETRGVNIPYVSPDYETNIKGVFIVGDRGHGAYKERDNSGHKGG